MTRGPKKGSRMFALAKKLLAGGGLTLEEAVTEMLKHSLCQSWRGAFDHARTCLNFGVLLGTLYIENDRYYMKEVTCANQEHGAEEAVGHVEDSSQCGDGSPIG